VKQETAYKVFKDWLKQSLLKQRDEHVEKRYRDQEKREIEERERKAAANKKIMARIAYKEWKERKLEEDRQQRKLERIERRERLIGDQQRYSSNAEAIEKLRRANAQMNGGGEVMLAYGLNKNLKKLKSGGKRPKSAKPRKDPKRHYIPQQEMMQAQYHQYMMQQQQPDGFEVDEQDEEDYPASQDQE